MKITRYAPLTLLALLANAQTPAPPPKPGPDTLIFVDGEKLIGSLEHSTDTTVTFKSDMAGEITVEWSKVKELSSPRKFAVIEKGTHLASGKGTNGVAQGNIAVADQHIQVTSPSQPPVTLPTSSTADVVDQATFQKAFQTPNFFEDWTGSATGGVSLSLGTQDSRTYTSAISLARIIPTESWMDPSNRTLISFVSSFGKLTQPGEPSVKTSLFHADAERDQYFSPRVYAFGDAAFSHDYSQGLDLQQTYGGGIGWSALRGVADLDLKAEVDYVDQHFQSSANNQKLLGSTFSEDYTRKFWKKIVLHEQAAVLPAWTYTRAYSAHGIVSLTIPAFKRIGFTVSALDTFLNDPSPGFRKNSFVFTAGATYTLAQ